MGERAGQWARAIGLPENLVEDLVTAGRHHDDGKADPRMQAALGAAVDESGFSFWRIRGSGSVERR